MQIHSKITKALLLLDRGKVLEAEESLRDALNDAEAKNDETNVVRACSVLGEVLYMAGRDNEARPLLQRAASAVRDDDLLDYEIARSAEILREIEAI